MAETFKKYIDIGIGWTEVFGLAGVNYGLIFLLSANMREVTKLGNSLTTLSKQLAWLSRSCGRQIQNKKCVFWKTVLANVVFDIGFAVVTYHCHSRVDWVIPYQEENWNIKAQTLWRVTNPIVMLILSMFVWFPPVSLGLFAIVTQILSEICECLESIKVNRGLQTSSRIYTSILLNL